MYSTVETYDSTFKFHSPYVLIYVIIEIRVLTSYLFEVIKLAELRLYLIKSVVVSFVGTFLPPKKYALGL